MTEVRAKKALGQHFLVDLNIARTICEALSGGTAEAPATVLEVGCGMGVLTQFLLQRGDLTTYGAEIDTESVDYLHDRFPAFAPRLIAGDFLKMDLRAAFPGVSALRIIGKFPYNISSQIFFKILEHREFVPDRVPLHGQRVGFQPAAQGQKRCHPAAAQRRRAARLRRAAVRPRRQGVVRAAAQDDSQLPPRRVR